MRKVISGDMVDPFLSPAARAAVSAATASALESATLRTGEWREARGSRGGRSRFGTGHHVRHELGLLLDVSLEELGRLAVGDAEPHSDRLELTVDVLPHLPSALDGRKRAEQGVERRRRRFLRA